MSGLVFCITSKIPEEIKLLKKAKFLFFFKIFTIIELNLLRKKNLNLLLNLLFKLIKSLPLPSDKKAIVEFIFFFRRKLCRFRVLKVVPSSI